MYNEVEINIIASKKLKKNFQTLIKLHFQVSKSHGWQIRGVDFR